MNGWWARAMAKMKSLVFAGCVSSWSVEKTFSHLLFFAIKFQFSPLPIRRTQKKQPAQLWFIDLKMDFCKILFIIIKAAERLNLALFHFFSSLSLFSQINVNVVRVSSSHRFSCMKCLLWCFFFTNIRNNKFSKPRRSNQIWISSPHPGTMRWAEDLSDLH